MNEIKQGDVVQLKSGGPRMTVSLVAKDKDNVEVLSACCDWFEGSKAVKGTFPLHSLKHAEQ